MAEDALKALIASINEKLDTTQAIKDFSENSKSVVKLFNELKKALLQSDQARNSRIVEAVKALEDKFASLEATVNARIATIKDGLPGKDGVDGTTPDIAEVARLAADLIKLPEYRAPIMDGPEELATKLDLLDDENQLQAIKELKDEIEKLKRTKPAVYAPGVSGGNVIRLHDLSASLNGSTKTFALPAFWRITMVTCSSFPNALRPTVDYTVDAAAMTITFTSEINAASTLATGQTVLVQYATTV